MNLDPRVIEMMHARIDGVISERENSELLEFLARNPEARERFDELERISKMLDGAEQVAPPAALRNGIMAAIQPSASPRSPVSQRGGKMVLRYAYAAAAGLVLGALAYHFVTNGNLDRTGIAPTDASGTMTAVQAQVETPIIGEINLDLPRGRGTVFLENVEGGASVLVDLDWPSAIEVVLAFDAERVGFRGLTQELGDLGSLEVTDGTVTWTQQGHNRVAVVVKLPGESTATIDLQLLADGEPVHSAVLSLPVLGSNGRDSEGTDSDVDSSGNR